VNMASFNLADLINKTQVLPGADHLRYGDLRYANLEKVNLEEFRERGPNTTTTIYLDLTGANLQQANLKNAEFSNASNIDGANLQYANLVNCWLPISTRKAPDLRHAILINAHPYFNSWTPEPKLNGAKFFKKGDFENLRYFQTALNSLIYDLYLFHMTSAQIELFRQAIVSDLLIRCLHRIKKDMRKKVLQTAYEHPLFLEQYPAINAVNVVATKLYKVTKFNFFKPIETEGQKMLRHAMENEVNFVIKP